MAEEVVRNRASRGFVTETAPAQTALMFGLSGGGGLSEVMSQHCEEQDAPAGRWGLTPCGQLGEGIAAMCRMSEHIAFRMPLGVLRAVAQGGDFREVHQPAGFLEDLQAPGGTDGLRCPLVPFAPDAFDREFIIGVYDATAQSGGFRCEAEIETCGELKGAQHAQRVLHKSRAGVAQDTVA